MVETHTRILGIAPYDGMRTAMEQAAQAYPNVELEVYTGDLEEGQAIVQRMVGRVPKVQVLDAKCRFGHASSSPSYSFLGAKRTGWLPD